MRSESAILGLPKGTDTLLRDLVHERTGIYFDAAKADLMLDKLSSLVIRRGFHSFLEYYYLLKYDDSAADEWRQVMNALAVGETYFWREIDQVHALVDRILPAWVAVHPRRNFRIWSAACASGEEPLTLAMALEEAGWFDRLAIQIFASDASSDAIERAKFGVYRERSFRNLSRERRLKYFRPEGSGTWKVQPELQSRVQYSVANLVNEREIRPFAPADVIFCRNVFIYFSEASISRVARVLETCMSLPGYLFVGTSESLLRARTNLVLEDVDNAFVYAKERA